MIEIRAHNDSGDVLREGIIRVKVIDGSFQLNT
jgi:hypothetical protein